MAARDTKKNSDDGGEGEAPGAKRKVSMLQIWFEEAWEGWLKSIGSILLLLAAYGLYHFELVGEGLAGAALVLGVIGGSLGSSGAARLWPLKFATLRRRGCSWRCLAIAVLATGYPSMRAAVPGRVLGQAHLTPAQQTRDRAHRHRRTIRDLRRRQLQAGGRRGRRRRTTSARSAPAAPATRSRDRSRARSMRVRTSRRGGTTTTTQEAHRERAPHAQRARRRYHLLQRRARRRAARRRAHDPKCGRARPTRSSSSC